MSSAFERIVNLALFLAAEREPVPTSRVRTSVEGYPPDQDDQAFARMFERDKDELRAMGFEITSDNEGRNRLDTAATFAENIEFSAEELAAVRAVGTALLEDPTFPYATELRFALAKMAAAVEEPDVAIVARMADERPADQGEAVESLERAVTSRKRVAFKYTNSRGERKAHEIEPYGLFVRDGRWYAVGRDVEIDEIRVYAVARLSALTTDARRPKTADFERPDDFDVARFIGLPFQYGTSSFEAVLRFGPDDAWRARALSYGAGSLEPVRDGSVLWTVTARDPRRLARWVVENGPGVDIVAPDHARDELRAGLTLVADAHGGGST